MNGCLSLRCHQSHFSVFDVWALKRHSDWSSWEKSISVYLPSMIVYNITSIGKFLVWQYLEEKFKIVNPSQDTQEQSQGDDDCPFEVKVRDAGGYVESLISPFGIIKSTKEENHESICCKPPTSCGFTPKNATYWEVPKTGLASLDSDCNTWSNDQNKLCYDCKSCKAGVLANLRMERAEWRHFLIFYVIIIAILCHLYGWLLRSPQQ